MGVSGCGKSTVGEALAALMDWEYHEGDAYHPPENVAKMARGEPLNDDDRAPWLTALRVAIEQMLENDSSGVVACSALKEAYRERLLIDHPDVHFVYLHGDFDTIYNRMKARAGHYMKAAMLQSQFDALEPPGKEALRLDVTQPPDVLVAAVSEALGLNTVP